jgi:hypothetical protein
MSAGIPKKRMPYNTLGHKLRFPQAKKAQFVTVMGIIIGPRKLREKEIE